MRSLALLDVARDSFIDYILYEYRLANLVRNPYMYCLLTEFIKVSLNILEHFLISTATSRLNAAREGRQWDANATSVQIGLHRILGMML